jgi:hypothetical protein
MMEEEEEIGRNALDEKGERNRRDKKSSVALIQSDLKIYIEKKQKLFFS